MERVLLGYDFIEMIFQVGAAPAIIAPAVSKSGGTLGLWDDDSNGQITCREVRNRGIAPVPRNHPAYRCMRDGDSDGVVCE